MQKLNMIRFDNHADVARRSVLLSLIISQLAAWLGYWALGMVAADATANHGRAIYFTCAAIGFAIALPIATLLLAVIYKLQAATRHSRLLANLDPLTGLLNRRGLAQSLDQLMTRETAEGIVRQHAFMIIDIDHFKLINDRLGHASGDAILRKSASRIQDKARHGDLVSRLGGEEFGLVLIDCDRAGAWKAADRVRKGMIDTAFVVDGATVDVSVSVGVALFDTNEAFDTVYKRADMCMYRAKHGGRNRTVLDAATGTDGPAVEARGRRADHGAMARKAV